MFCQYLKLIIKSLFEQNNLKTGIFLEQIEEIVIFPTLIRSNGAFIKSSYDVGERDARVKMLKFI